MIADAGFAPSLPEPQTRTGGRNGGVIKQIPVLRPLSNEERQLALKEADESQQYQRQQEAAQLAADLEDMREFDRYGKLLEMEMCGSELTSEWRRFMRVYEQMQNDRDREYWDGQRAAFAVLYKKNPAADEAAAG